ncbi:MAG: ImmA/IrrE family metallo-endopeptidase [Bacteroidaceae bacterium]
MIDIKKVVDNLQKKYNTLDPYEIASHLNISITRCELGSLKGYYYKSFRTKQIILNLSLDRTQERFVLSHELGHSIMHPDCNTMFLKTYSKLSVDKMEIQANRFAMQLLISDLDLKEYNGYSVSYISRTLGYSEELIELRLKSQ